MTCDGHGSHPFELDEECRYCGHPRSEHNENGWWEDNRGRAEPPDPIDEYKREAERETA